MSDVTDRQSKLFLAGHSGLLGTALRRALAETGYRNVVIRSREELDLTNSADVSRFLAAERPDWVLVAAGKVGGIRANESYPADFIWQNIAIQTNLIDGSWKAGVKNLLLFGSSCIYPRDCPQPIKEEYLLSGPLERTNSAYAVAKISGIEMCAAYNRQFGTRYFCAMSTSLYGPGDHYDPKKSHVLPALIRKMHEAKISGASEITAWGTGMPRRELMCSDDLAAATLHVMALDEAGFAHAFPDPRLPMINVGTGSDITIRELAYSVREVVGFSGEIVWDPAQPDGTPRKLLDVSRISATGWRARVPLKDGIRAAYDDFLSREGAGHISDPAARQWAHSGTT